MSSRAKAKNIIAQASRTYKSTGLDFIAFALSGKKVDFSKVIFMIEDMVKVLKKEQVDDDTHKSYCEKEFDTADDSKKSTERDIVALQHSQEEAETRAKNLAAEIDTLQGGIE